MHVGSDDGWEDSQLRLAERKDGVVGGDDDIADRGEPDAATKRRAVDAADERHWQRVEELEHPREILGVAEVVLTGVGDRLRHPGEVRASAKRGTFTGEHDRAERRIFGRASSQRSQRRDDFFIEGIPHLGPIEADSQNAVMFRRTVAAGGREDGHGRRSYMRKTPNLGSASGALHAADRPSASAWRVSAGSRIPSSQSRAVE